MHRLRDEHHFLHCLVHGARVDSRAQARWAVDAFAILCREPDAFSWDEVFAAADEARLRPWLEPALAWLDHLRPGIGEVAPSHGSSAAVEGRDRFLWWLDSHALRPGVGLDLQRTLRTHLARSRDRGLLAGLSSYPGFLLESGLVTSPRQVLRHLLRHRRERRAASRIAST